MKKFMLKSAWITFLIVAAIIAISAGVKVEPTLIIPRLEEFPESKVDGEIAHVKNDFHWWSDEDNKWWLIKKFNN